jgi:hypothetical protein
MEEFLKPDVDLLCQEHVLVQAWKKTNRYIRSHNWYADTLELDLATADLRGFIRSLQRDLENLDVWQNNPLRLVPAPKSHEWYIDGLGRWRPKGGSKAVTKALRPLAHVSLKDQVVAAAIMLCLADRVETRQGDPRGKFRNR